MNESYSGRSGSGPPPRIPSPGAVTELHAAFAREMIARLLPSADADKVVRALLSEREATDAPAEPSHYNSDEEVATRELARVRAQFALGETARTLQHAFNNPLTALLAEAQLLEGETMADEHRAALARMLELTRRLVSVSRRLEVASTTHRVG